MNSDVKYKHYELDVPSDYKVSKVIDCKDPKTAFLFTLFSLIISIILIVIGIFIKLSLIKEEETIGNIELFILTSGFLIGYIIIIIAHELIHGLFYKIYTKQKLTFGITLTAAFCGVPNVYVRKKAMMITCMAPCVILSMIFLILMIVFFDSSLYIFFLLLFSLHFGGCIGDIYCCILFLFKYKNKDILINDTGLKQTIYVKK